ncbi:M6 metalloprotease [Purpureocillium lavendulum]|uniref:M6 metalloprotease n=1 Tax=Purpureocillium lavendulum TaxID=1247861 RepID=A0AB34FSI6_9HYPO|nr:M6 metalloprotease [Purpureocillium lavendulum]
MAMLRAPGLRLVALGLIVAQCCQGNPAPAPQAGGGSQTVSTVSTATSAVSSSGASSSGSGSITSSGAASNATSAPPVVSVANVTSHGSYTGPPANTTGPLTASVAAASISGRPPSPSQTTYSADGRLHGGLAAPYTPKGGQGTNGSAPVYRVQSDFDYESVALALYQEWIELDLFHWGLARFSVQDFQDAGLTAEDRYLLQFMAEQEVGHATALTNMLGPQAPVQCAYNYPVTTVREYIDFCQKLTRWGEAGVYGFLNHLDSREVGQILLQSITTEARQQMIFRQFEGLFPMPVWFEVGIPQSWAWSLLAPFISSCPANQTRLVWQNIPALRIVNQPNPFRRNGSAANNETIRGSWGANVSNTTNLTAANSCTNATRVGERCGPAITNNRTTPLSYAGRRVYFEWDEPGTPIGPNNSYVTNTTAGQPQYAAWVTQLNVTYSRLQNVSGRSAYTLQPNTSTYVGDPAINGTVFVALTDTNLFVTPYNLSMLNPHVVALGMYQAG